MTSVTAPAVAADHARFLPSADSVDTAHLVIDLDAVAFNYLLMKSRLSTGVDCAAVVKADAYGLGAAKIAPVLFAQGCRHFFVAQAREGLVVKESLPQEKIPGNDVSVYVLDGLYGLSLADFAASGLVPVLNTPHDLEVWAAEAGRQSRKLPAVLHIDTGMNRLGFAAADHAWLCEGAGSRHLAALDIKYVMSHLACADDPAHAGNAAQLERFKAVLDRLPRIYRASLANAGGILLGPAYHFDMARPGCALYGINPFSTGAPSIVKPVVHFSARILQIRDIAAGDSIGYGASYKAPAARRTATIGIGYADGFLRVIQKVQGGVYAGDTFCPVVGRVSMDSAVIDVTGTTARAGDWVEVLGTRQTVDALAWTENTIGYEILTGLGKRIKRQYIGG